MTTVKRGKIGKKGKIPSLWFFSPKMTPGNFGKICKKGKGFFFSQSFFKRGIFHQKIL